MIIEDHIWGVISILGVFLVCLAFGLYRLSLRRIEAHNRELKAEILKRQSIEEELRRSNERISGLAGRMITVQEDERKWIAQELHDDLNQKLASLAISISKLKRGLPALPGFDDSLDDLREQLTNLHKNTVAVSNDVRKISHRLHPEILEHLGLDSAIKSFCAEFNDQYGIKVGLEIQGDLKSLPEDVALCLYRVAQEALRNVWKHSGANVAQVRLGREMYSVVLIVADQGSGFHIGHSDEKNGLGLISIEERVKLLDGTFRIKSEAGEGTELQIYIPLIRERDLKSEI